MRDRKSFEPTIWRTIETRHGSASWAVVDRVLHVRSALGEKRTQLGGSKPETLVGLLMSELARGDDLP